MPTYRLRDELFMFVMESKYIQKAIKAKLDMSLFIFNVNALLGHPNNEGITKSFDMYLKSIIPWSELESKNELEDLVETYNKYIKK